MDKHEIRGPFDFGQTLDATFRLLRRCFLPLLLTSLAVAVPVAVVTGVGIDAATTSYDVGAAFGFGDEGVVYDDEASWALVQFGTVLLQSLAPGLVVVLCLDLVLRRARGEQIATFAASARKCARYWWPLTVASLLGALGIFAGFIFCLIPGIWLLILWIVAGPALFDESLSGTAALSRSRELVRGRWWATFGRYLAGSLIAGVAANFFVLGFGAIAGAVFDPTSTAALVVLQSGYAVGTAITTPVVVCLIVVIYVDLKARSGSAERAAGQPDFRGFAPPSPGA